MNNNVNIEKKETAASAEKIDKIVICDDDKDIVRALQIYLSNRNYELLCAYTGREALDFVKKGDVSLVLLDIMMPEMDGITALRAIREKSNVPVILITAKSEDADKVLGLDVGADDYMTKPFSPSELVARVKAHMERYNRLVGSNVKKNDFIEIRGIKIDKTARRVWVNGEETTFTSKEYDLLTFLAENPNRVFTKEELFREIWDMESVGDIATVTVHIKKIREKIEFNTAKPQYIETIWGVGYRFKG